MLNGIALGVVLLVAHPEVPPRAQPAATLVAPAAFTFATADTTRLVQASRLALPARRTTARAIAQRHNTTDRVLAIAAGIVIGGLVGGGVGFYATSSRDGYDDGVGGLKGMAIGLPIGAAVGGILGYRLTK